MKLLYSKENCPACVTAKNTMIQNNIPYKEIMIGRDITREEFMEKFPGIRTVPHLVEDNELQH
jgi:glutaredoxin